MALRAGDNGVTMSSFTARVDGAWYRLFMTGYKDQPKASPIEREFPHHVDILVPPHGLGTRLEAMYHFHAAHGIKPQRGQPKYDIKGSVIRWYFADANLAAVFAKKFGT
jgi:hypothetical protein